MKHTCGHEINWQHIVPLRLSIDHSSNRVLCEMACSIIPCYQCIADAYENLKERELESFGMQPIHGGTFRQRAYAHFIRHILTYGGVLSDKNQPSKFWIDVWTVLPDLKKKSSKEIFDAVREQYDTERRATKAKEILDRAHNVEKHELSLKERYFKGDDLNEEEEDSNGTA